ncbi:MAG: pantoate--beta-alanine ligase [Coriobacteriia bacterium]
MERISGKSEVRSAVADARREGRTIALVPTMGALHDGHLSLVRAARLRADFVVASVFVNPTQFGPNEDFDRYPRRLEADLELLGADGVDVVFTPSAESMYQDGTDVIVDPGALALRWEGALRPSHFSGVATVVAKLFNLVKPDLAFFGEKDYQQLMVISRMARQLDFGVGIVGCPTVRDTDGLALSSRNVNLSPAERTAGLGLPEALAAAASMVAWGETGVAEIEAEMREVVASHAEGGLSLDYAVLVDSDTLEPLDRLDHAARALIAGRVGSTHLIDNCALVVPGTSA